jgi:hypothetical protein
MDSLMDATCRRDIQSALDNLERGDRGLEKAYEKAIKRLHNQLPGLAALAVRALMWIIFAQRPLKASELEHALAINVGDTYFDEWNVTGRETIVRSCVGLVTIDQESDVVALVHSTTQQFLDKYVTELGTHDADLTVAHAQRTIAGVCVTYLSFEVFATDFTESSHPFYSYALHYWCAHSCLGLTESDQPIHKIIQDLAALFKIAVPPGALINRPEPDGTATLTPLHLAAYFGLPGTVTELISKGYGVDATDDFWRTPLHYAVARGRFEVPGF